MIKTIQKVVLHYVILRSLQVDQHTLIKWLIYGTKHHKHNQLQSVNSPVVYHCKEYKHDIKESDGATCPIQYSKRMSSGRNIQGGV